jgi:hypothetical protein
VRRPVKFGTRQDKVGEHWPTESWPTVSWPGQPWPGRH